MCPHTAGIARILLDKHDGPVVIGQLYSRLRLSRIEKVNRSAGWMVSEISNAPRIGLARRNAD